MLVIGSLNADLVMRAPRLPQPGETVIGATFSVVAGGKGANQAVAAARLGAPVAMIGRIGNDAFGALVRGELSCAGVRTDHVRVDPEAYTGTAQIVVDEDGHNAIVVASGANARLEAADVLPDSAWEGARLVVLQLEVPMTSVAASIQKARKRQVPVLLNAAPAQPLSSELLEAISWLVVNEVEAGQLAGAPIRSVEEAAAAARALHHSGKQVVVTLGAAGAICITDSELLHVPAPRVDVIDTTAAGDAFVGALAAALYRGASPAIAVREAVVAGSLACTKAGAIPSLPTRAEVEEVIRDPVSCPEATSK